MKMGTLFSKTFSPQSFDFHNDGDILKTISTLLEHVLNKQMSINCNVLFCGLCSPGKKLNIIFEIVRDSPDYPLFSDSLKYQKNIDLKILFENVFKAIIKDVESISVNHVIVFYTFLIDTIELYIRGNIVKKSEVFTFIHDFHIFSYELIGADVLKDVYSTLIT